jgi:hypothetical protein
MVDAFATIDPITLLAKQFCHGEPGAMGLSRMLMHPMRDFSPAEW